MSVKNAIFERPYLEARRRIETEVIEDAPHAGHLLAHDHGCLGGITIASVILDLVGRTKPPLLSWLCRPARGHFLQANWRPTFGAAGCGPDKLSAALLVAYIEEALTGTTSNAIKALRLIAENTGWLMPHERLCWLSERPETSCTDTDGRLHCAWGPALSYRDGYKLYAWKGVTVSAWVILRPRDITLDWIDAQIDSAVRHAMIDILTAERFVGEGGAERVAQDGSGTLWSRKWTFHGTVIDAWSAVEYPGTSSKRVFEPVPTCIRSPNEALDWLFGPSGAKATESRQ